MENDKTAYKGYRDKRYKESEFKFGVPSIQFIIIKDCISGTLGIQKPKSVFVEECTSLGQAVLAIWEKENLSNSQKNEQIQEAVNRTHHVVQEAEELQQLYGPVI